MHLASFMFKMPLNADKNKNDFLSSLKKGNYSQPPKVSIDDMEYFIIKALYQFTILQIESPEGNFIQFLQTLLCYVLLHDVGHLPFSQNLLNGNCFFNTNYQKIKKSNQELLC